MPTQGHSLDYDTICNIIGKLFLDFYVEQRNQTAQFNSLLSDAQQRIKVLTEKCAALEDDNARLRT